MINRNHLYSDLRPYTCLFPDCQYNVEPFTDRQLWSDHLELEHDLGPQWNSIQCTLCFQSTGEGKKTILRHLARHLEDVAVTSLPRDVESDVESETSSDSELEPSIQAASTTHTKPGTLKPSRVALDLATVAPAANVAYLKSLTQDIQTRSQEDDAVRFDSTTIKCICGFVGDDGNTVLCEGCNTWQHIICFYEPAEDVPDVHECIDCAPRPMNTRRAADLQRQQRERFFSQRQTEQQREDYLSEEGEDSDREHISSALSSPHRQCKTEGLTGDPPGPHHETEPERHTLKMINTKAEIGGEWNSVGSVSNDTREDIPQPVTTYSRTGRVTKAKNGLRVHECKCGRSYTRAAHLRRHQRNHTQSALVCRQPGCEKIFYRADLLERHEQRQ